MYTQDTFSRVSNLVDSYSRANKSASYSYRNTLEINIATFVAITALIVLVMAFALMSDQLLIAFVLLGVGLLIYTTLISNTKAAKLLIAGLASIIWKLRIKEQETNIKKTISDKLVTMKSEIEEMCSHWNSDYKKIGKTALAIIS
jgi:hypothetical protein